MIKIGIVGYGNLGRGAELAVAASGDMELAALFSRRVLDHARYQAFDKVRDWRGRLDVLLLCGGSAQDLPSQGPELAKWFHTVDSFDTHAEIPGYFAKMEAAARAGGTVAILSTGWDPGLFSLMRVLGEAVLPQGKGYTFWGRGVSQGHSDAIRRVPGVADARQYTVPSAEAMERVRAGENPELTAKAAHKRECYVVLEEGADPERVRREIVEMPNYFAGYETSVTFVSMEELVQEHAGLPHGGAVIRHGVTGAGNRQGVEFGLQLGSNPEFTASVLVAYARAAHRLAKQGESGARTVLDVPPGLLSPKTAEELRRDML